MKDNQIEEKILDAALKVVSTNTISGTRMHLIAETAEIPKSNLHYYYKTKQNLMLALHKKVVTRFIEIRRQIRPKCKDELADQLEVFFRQKMDCILQEPEYDIVELDFWLQANINPEYRTIMKTSFAIWRKEINEMQEKYVPELSKEKKEQLPNVIISLLEGATMQYHLDKENFNVKSYLRFSNALVLDILKNKY